MKEVEFNIYTKKDTRLSIDLFEDFNVLDFKVGNVCDDLIYGSYKTNAHNANIYIQLEELMIVNKAECIHYRIDKGKNKVYPDFFSTPKNIEVCRL
jgi:hypothetical protein